MANQGTRAGIKVRYPEFDLSQSPVVWGANAEATLRWNATSLVVKPIEIFLLKVMRKAKAELDRSADSELLRDVDLFNKQEAQHFKTHAAFNKVIRDWCADVEPIEQEFEDDLNRFVETMPLRWLLGYCDAFEAVGGLSAIDWVDGDNSRTTSSFDSVVEAMWRWHLAEEYEHRDVVWRVYQSLFGSPPEAAHNFRIELVVFATKHFGGFSMRMYEAMLATYRQAMTDEEVQASVQRQQSFLDTSQKEMEERLGTVFSPYYDPRAYPRPAQLDEVLAVFSRPRRSPAT